MRVLLAIRLTVAILLVGGLVAAVTLAPVSGRTRSAERAPDRPAQDVVERDPYAFPIAPALAGDVSDAAAPLDDGFGEPALDF